MTTSECAECESESKQHSMISNIWVSAFQLREVYTLYARPRTLTCHTRLLVHVRDMSGHAKLPTGMNVH